MCWKILAKYGSGKVRHNMLYILWYHFRRYENEKLNLNFIALKKKKLVSGTRERDCTYCTASGLSGCRSSLGTRDQPELNSEPRVSRITSLNSRKPLSHENVNPCCTVRNIAHIIFDLHRSFQHLPFHLPILRI